MSKPFMTMIIIAGLVILFVLSRWFGGNEISSLWQNSNSLNQDEFISWVEYTPDSKSFTIKFPRAPQETSFSSNDIPNFRKHYKNYAADGIDKVIFMLQEISYEGKLEDKENFLQNLLYDIVSSTQASLLNSKEFEFQNREAISFETEKGERKTKGIIFQKDHKIYILSKTIDKDAEENNNEFEYFIRSLKIN